jgi:hypothetical protein
MQEASANAFLAHRTSKSTRALEPGENYDALRPALPGARRTSITGFDRKRGLAPYERRTR